MWEALATHIFSAKKIQHICVSLHVNFNESLTNDVVSFEQLGPDVKFVIKQFIWTDTRRRIPAMMFIAKRAKISSLKTIYVIWKHLLPT